MRDKEKHKKEEKGQKRRCVRGDMIKGKGCERRSKWCQLETPIKRRDLHFLILILFLSSFQSSPSLIP